MVKKLNCYRTKDLHLDRTSLTSWGTTPEEKTPETSLTPRKESMGSTVSN